MIKAIWQKINNKHFLSLAGNGIMAVMSMVTVALLFRFLSSEHMGYWVLFQTFSVLVDTFRTGFLQVALIKFYTGTDIDRAKKVLGSIWYLAVMITLVFCLINAALIPFLPYIKDEGFVIVIQWVGLSLLAILPSAIATWILQADQRFDLILIFRFLSQGSFILAIITLIFTNHLSLRSVLMAYVIINAIISVGILFAGWSRASTIIHRTKESIVEIYHFGKFSVGTTISANLLRASDTIIIGSFMGPAAIAIYNLPNRLMELIEIPIRSTLATGMSSMAKAVNSNNKKEVAYILAKYSGTLMIAFIPVSIGAILLADVAISLLGGGKYIHTEAANLYRYFMVIAIFYPVERFIAVGLDIIHQPKINFIKVTIMLIANVICDFIGIKVFNSLYGVAVATTIPLIIGILFGYYHLKKHIDFSFREVILSGRIQIRRIIRTYITKRKHT
jgi:O-antigen/teichoic acid export membrane protein